MQQISGRVGLELRFPELRYSVLSITVLLFPLLSSAFISHIYMKFIMTILSAPFLEQRVTKEWMNYVLFWTQEKWNQT